jgi:peptidoglycan/LPS O-acetylase OafA/YrhL
MFYASLLLTAFVARLPRWHVALPVVGLILGLFYTAWRTAPAVVAPTPLCAALFSIGMLCAAMEKNGWVPRLPPWASSSLVVILTLGAFAVSPTANAVAPVLLLGVAFFLVVFGSDVFGLLSGQAARRLGDISYGIYLLQGLVLDLVFSVPGARAFALGSPLQHWLMVLFCALLLVTAAAITHVWVERPGIDAGRALVKWLSPGKRATVPVT